MGWVAVSDYSKGEPDPLFESRIEIIKHMNTDHKDALILSAEGIESALKRIFNDMQAQRMTPKTMKSSCNPANRAQIERRLNTHKGRRPGDLTFGFGLTVAGKLMEGGHASEIATVPPSCIRGTSSG
jgi:hypothetical protein